MHAATASRRPHNSVSWLATVAAYGAALAALAAFAFLGVEDSRMYLLGL